MFAQRKDCLQSEIFGMEGLKYFWAYPIIGSRGHGYRPVCLTTEIARQHKMHQYFIFVLFKQQYLLVN